LALKGYSEEKWLSEQKRCRKKSAETTYTNCGPMKNVFSLENDPLKGHCFVMLSVGKISSFMHVTKYHLGGKI
jgi:hypothetical protein